MQAGVVVLKQACSKNMTEEGVYTGWVVGSSLTSGGAMGNVQAVL